MNNPNTSTRAIETVSSKNPCVHCQKPDWCYVLLNGASCCKRGFVHPNFEDSGKKDKQGTPILYPIEWGKKKPKPKVLNSTEWIYLGRNLIPLVKVIRQDLDDANKKIFQNYKGKNGWITKRPQSIERSDIPVYQLSLIRKAMEDDRHIFIVEGEKCADLLISMGLIATTNIQGSNNFSDSDLKDFWDNNTNSYHDKIILVPDRDEPGLKLMKQWERGLTTTQWLYPFPEKDWGNVPPDNGLDLYDWIADNQLAKQDVIDAIGKKPESLKVAVKTSTPLQETTTYTDDPNPEESYSDEKARDIEYDTTPQMKAINAVYGDKPYIALEDDLYFWNGTHYEKCKPGREKQRLKYWAENTPVYDPKLGKAVYKYLTVDWINKFWNMALLHFAVDPDLINPPGLNLANGVLKITIKGKEANWKIVEHSPKNYFLYCSEVKFNEKADPKSCNDLLLCLDEAPRTAFLRQVAASLDLESVRKVRGRDIRAAICLGSGANGKDSLNEAIAAIFTDNQMCSAGFNQFIAYDNGRQFTLAKLRGSKINWASENNKDNSLDHSQSLNIAITGDRGLEFERKGKDAEPFIAQCIHFFSCNQLPKMKSGLDSLMSRFAVYQFSKTFTMNPNPARGELQADPRFKYDREFVTTQVAPALLNTILAELKNLLIDGIDYDAIKSSMDDIQEESTHLWGFCHDYALSANPDKGVYINDLWEYLKSWYIETGTLEIEEMSDGKRRNIWHEQANSFDKNITGANQVYKRLKTLFPKISKHRDTRDGENVGKFYIWGLELQNYASVLQSPCKSRVSASVLLQSPSVSLPEAEKGKNEAKKEQTEAESTLDQQTEALKQTDHIQYRPDPNRREDLLQTISFWKSGLNWSQNQLKAFAKEKIGLDSSKEMTEAQLFNLGQLLSKEIPLKAKKSEF